MISHSAFLLGYPDSNQERQDQNLQCYHYTISQCRFAKLETVVPCLRVQRYKLFLYPARKSRKIFKKSCVLTVLCEKRIIFCNFWDFWGRMSRLLSNFALAKWKRALTFGQSRLTPLFYQKTLKRARMLRTLYSQNKTWARWKSFIHNFVSRVIIKNKKKYLSGFNKGISWCSR